MPPFQATHFSVIALTELAIPHLEKTKGNIINVSSTVAVKTHPSSPFYSIAKAGLDHFARNYAAICAPMGIRVNNLNPGMTDTAFGTRHGIPREVIEKVRNNFHKSSFGSYVFSSKNL